MTQILAAIVALGFIAKLIHWVWKRYWSADAEKRKLKKQLEEVRKQMYQALLDGRNDDYDRLRTERDELHKQLSNLH